LETRASLGIGRIGDPEFQGGAGVTLQQLKYVAAIEKHGSFSKAAKSLYVSQPGVSSLVKDLEDELRISIFTRNRKGIVLTQEGKDLLKYAHQMIDQEGYILDYFRGQRARPTTFSVSSQHYSFVVDIFTSLENSLQTDKYILRLRETTTSKVIEDVAKQRSEIGIMFLGEFSSKQINRLLKENNLSFTPLYETIPHVFLRGDHPLSKRKSVNADDLAPYPCIIYDQDDDTHPFLSEETILFGRKPPKVLYVSDLFSCVLMIEKCDAYNIGTGLFPDYGDSDAYAAIPLSGQAPMTVGWIRLNNADLSPLATEFISLLQSYFERR